MKFAVSFTVMYVFLMMLGVLVFVFCQFVLFRFASIVVCFMFALTFYVGCIVIPA